MWLSHRPSGAILERWQQRLPGSATANHSASFFLCRRTTLAALVGRFVLATVSDSVARQELQHVGHCEEIPLDSHAAGALVVATYMQSSHAGSGPGQPKYQPRD